VVADYVSTLGDFADDVGPLTDIAANQEERSLDIMSRQNVKQIARVRIVGPIVEGQCDLLRSSVAAAESASKPLPGRGKRLISGRHQGGTGGSGKHKHARILMEVRNTRIQIADVRFQIPKSPRIRTIYNLKSTIKFLLPVNFFRNCARVALGIFSIATSHIHGQAF
jgi:hypothetical protein